MDRHARDLRQLRANRAVKLFSRGMVGAILDCGKNGPPLGGDGQACFAVRGEEAIHSMLFFCRTHLAG